MKKGIIVIKVGTSTLIKKVSGREVLDRQSFISLGGKIRELRHQGYAVIVVSSAAITAGMGAAGIVDRPNRKTSMPELQRLASIGWRHVLNEWACALPGMMVGEVLLTRRELDRKTEQDELVHVISALISHGDIPIVNENDAIAHEEIAYGDNDTLAAALAVRIAQSSLFDVPVRLMLLSDVDGVYRDRDDSSTRIAAINDLDKFEHLASGACSAYGTGGMVTKFQAARVVGTEGIVMHIANGRDMRSLTEVLAGEIGTRFEAVLG